MPEITQILFSDNSGNKETISDFYTTSQSVIMKRVQNKSFSSKQKVKASLQRQFTNNSLVIY